VIVTTSIRPEIVRKVLASVNVRPLMPPQIVTDVVRDITDIRIASLVNVSWTEQEEDNVKIQADNVPANKISAGNFVINVPMDFITSRNANVNIYLYTRKYEKINLKKCIIENCSHLLMIVHSLRVQRNRVKKFDM